MRRSCIAEFRSALIDHGARLKVVGWKLSHCHLETELLDLLESGMRFRFLIFDGFELDSDALSPEYFAGFESFDGIVLIANVALERRLRIIGQAMGLGWPLKLVLQAPSSDCEFTRVVFRELRYCCS